MATRAKDNDTPLRLVLNVVWQSRDPITSGSYVTRDVAYMVSIHRSP